MPFQDQTASSPDASPDMPVFQFRCDPGFSMGQEVANAYCSFIGYCTGKLGITDPFTVYLSDGRNAEGMTTAYYQPHTGLVCVNARGRSTVDICRSIAHEMVHHKQNQNGMLTGDIPDIGGHIEDEANALAGRFVKSYGRTPGNESVYDTDAGGAGKSGQTGTDKVADVKSALNEGKGFKREFGCLMLLLGDRNWERITGMINPGDLYDAEGYGLETEPHVTVLFGFHPHIDWSLLEESVNRIAAKPANITITGISHFETPEFDVVKLDVESTTLSKLNAFFRRNFPFTNKYDDYHPHITVGYVKKGTGTAYATTFTKPMLAASATYKYSHPDGRKSYWNMDRSTGDSGTDNNGMAPENGASPENGANPQNTPTHD